MKFKVEERTITGKQAYLKLPWNMLYYEEKRNVVLKVIGVVFGVVFLVWIYYRF